MEKTLTSVVRESFTSRRQGTEVSVLKEIGSWLAVILVALLVAFLLSGVIIVNAQVISGSMKNTLMVGDRVIGLRTVYWVEDPARGDIVFFRNPDNEKEVFVKRVIGLPGDTVEIISGVTYVNGEVLDEPYLAEEVAAKDFGPYEVPEDSYFLMGDNRNHSSDARYWEHTFVERSKILGKAYWVYYPRFERVE